MFATETAVPTAYIAVNIRIMTTIDFAYFGPAFAKLAIKLCAFSQEIVGASMSVFNSTKYASVVLTSEKKFLATFNISTTIFQNQISNTFRPMLQLLRINNNGNQLLTGSMTNAIIYRYSEDNKTYSDNNKIYVYWKCPYDETCNCGTSAVACAMSYSRYFEIYGNEHWNFSISYDTFISGLYVACNPLESFLVSTLECLYNSLCIFIVYMFVKYGEFTLSDPSRSANITAFPYTSESVFAPNTTLINIVNALMVDRWTSNISFDRYFSQCNPVVCVYTFTSGSDIIGTIVTVIGAAGGWSVILRILTPLIIAVIRGHEPNSTSVVDFDEQFESKCVDQS